MKNISVLALSAMTTIGAIPFCAYANPIPVPHQYANGIAAYNIITMQHSIMLNAFDNFSGSAALTLGHLPASAKPAKTEAQPQDVPVDEYGKMLIYGEYGDDGTVFANGRSGGEIGTTGINWFDWQHAQDKVRFDDFKTMSSRYDLISVGISDYKIVNDNGFAQFGGFGGAIIGNEKNGNIKLSENGGYLGLYGAYKIHELSIVAALNGGMLFNNAKSLYGTDSLTNFWTGAALNLSYNINISDTFVLQPGVYAGYTWIKSDTYTSKSDDRIENSNFRSTELSPSLRVIKHLGENWYGILSGRYVFNFVNGGDTKIAAVTLPELELLNYSEFGLSVEKSVDRFNIALSLNRHDGGRTGFNGGIHIRCMF